MLIYELGKHSCQSIGGLWETHKFDCWAWMFSVIWHTHYRACQYDYFRASWESEWVSYMWGLLLAMSWAVTLTMIVVIATSSVLETSFNGLKVISPKAGKTMNRSNPRSRLFGKRLRMMSSTKSMKGCLHTSQTLNCATLIGQIKLSGCADSWMHAPILHYKQNAHNAVHKDIMLSAFCNLLHVY